jgi:tetratricopeptide (TPR) repeat protein/tRNA A-37 threonylcarbamoyl transferase component Bud32
VYDATVGRTPATPPPSESFGASEGEETLAADGSSRHGDEFALSEGDTVGRYEVETRLGAGGMGVVYRAFDPELDRPVALKLLRRRRSTQLLAEAQAMARLAHPNVITVYDVGLHEERLFVAMEYLEGETLARWQAREHSTRDALGIYRAAGEGLAAAHEAGLVHRDFKPENVIVGRDGRVVVLDFGLARLRDDDDDSSSDTPASRRGTSTARSRPVLGKQTSASLVGTPAYMSPEQHLGHVVGPRSDQFSYCVALYEAIFAAPPFAGNTLLERSLAVLDGRPPDPPRGVVSRGVRTAILRGLARDPAHRHAGMPELLAELTPPRRGRAWALAGVFAAAASGVAATTMFAGQGEPEACTGGQARVGVVWPEARRAVLLEAFVDAEHGERTLATVDDWLSRWSAGHRDACEATAIRKEQSSQRLDLRMACLERAMVGLEESLVVLEEAGERMATQAPRVVAKLPHVEACADLDRLGETPRVTDDPEPQRTERTFGRLRALTHAGRYQDALERAASFVEELEARGAHSQVPAARGLWAEQALHLDQPERALGLIHRGLVSADTIGDDRARLRLLVTLVHAHGKAGHAEPATRAAERAGALLDRLGERGDERSALARHLGVMQYAAGRPADAKVHYAEALALSRDGTPGVEERTASIRNNLGLAHRDLGEYDQAIEQFELARSIWREFYGAAHPAVAIATMNLGTVYDEERRYEEALDAYRAARDSFERALGPESLDVGYCHEAEAISVGELGRYDEALESHGRAQAIFTEFGADATTDLAMSLDNMGVVYNRMGQFERSVELHRDALTRWEGASGPEHPDLAYPLVNLGQTLLKMERSAEARDVLERALRLREGAQVSPKSLALLRFDLARATEPTDPERALFLAAQARRVFVELEATREIERVRRWLERVGRRLAEVEANARVP